MPFVSEKRFAQLVARVKVLEEKLGEVDIPNLEEVGNLHAVYGFDTAELLLDGNLKTVAAVQLASDEKLEAIKGLGPATVKRIRKAGKE